MDDLISRQAAIDRINKQREHLQPDIYQQDKIGDAAYRICAEFIERLPSAQPEIVRCKDCKYSEHWYRDRRRCFLWSEDGVSVFDDGFCNYAEMKW